MPTLYYKYSSGEDQVQSGSKLRDTFGNPYKSGRKYLQTQRRKGLMEKLASNLPLQKSEGNDHLRQEEAQLVFPQQSQRLLGKEGSESQVFMVGLYKQSFCLLGKRRTWMFMSSVIPKGSIPKLGL